MNGLTPIQRLILALLEEAGEEELVTLVTTLRKRPLLVGALGPFATALTGLIESDLVRIAKSRDEAPTALVPLSKQESLALAKRTESFFQWSESEQIWRWRKDAPSLAVIVTDAGAAAALSVLSEDGWPADLA